MTHKILANILLLTSLTAFAQPDTRSFLDEIKIDSLKSYVYKLSSPQMEGRETGKKGGKMAADYIASIFRNTKLDSLNYTGYFQKFEIPGQDTLKNKSLQAQNVIAFIEGKQKTNETIIISAHYDHLGKINDSIIYFGADDNASGVALIIEIARVMYIAVEAGIKPERNILIIAFDAEEKEFLGSAFFVEHVPDQIGTIALNINLDMIGRNRHNDPEYSKSVFRICRGKNSGYYKRLFRQLNESNNDLIVSKYPLPFSKFPLTSDSDHSVFFKKGIPFVHLQTGMHSDYHRFSDTPDKINYKKLTEICKLLYKFIWEVADSD